MKGLIRLMIVALFLPACATLNTPQEDPKDIKSVIAFTKILRKGTSTGLDVVVAGLSDKSVKHDGYTEFNTWWCPRHHVINSVAAVRHEYEQFCAARGGVYGRPFCRKTTNRDDVIFYLEMVNSRKCSGGYPTAEVNILEPTGIHYAKDYIQALKKAGYMTAADEKFNELARQAEAVAEAEKAQRDAVLMQQIGTRICKDVRPTASSVYGLGHTLIGYVERVADKKIQVRVADARVGRNSNLRPGGFIPSIIWDYPTNWYVCE